MKKRHALIFCVVVLFIVSLACNLPGGTSTEEPKKDISKTEAALSARETEVAAKATENAQEPTQPPPTAALAATYTPYPTYTQPAAVVPTIVVPATVEAPVDMDEKIKNANILIFEDIRGYYDLQPWVSQATDSMS
ncbi:MAG: hypothetical protein ABFD14_06605, partial [Anaerolineaceae bacterium]